MSPASGENSLATGKAGVGVRVLNPMEPQWINFPVRADARGRLVPMEAERSVPFPIKRAYALVDLAPGGARGAHAHRALRQVVVALGGSCRVRLTDGVTERLVTLDEPGRGLVLDPLVWHELRDFSPDCILLVLAAEHYDEADYIRDWDEFERLVKVARAS